MTRRLALATRLARHAACVATGMLGLVLLASACAKDTTVGAGGECFLATDCAPGLVCVEQANKTRTCTDDLARVAGKRPPDAAAMDAGEDGGEGGLDGEAPDQSNPPPPPPTDAGGADQGNPPPPVDSGTPPQDAALE